MVVNSGASAAPGALIALEGIDGSGKSTQLRRLAAALKAAGHAVVSTFEPTDGPAGLLLRELARSTENPSPDEELRLFMEDRRQHVEEVLAPALAAGKIVLTDRYFLSTVAYQGARGLDPRELLEVSEARFPIPDLVLLFEVTPQLGLERVTTRGAAAEPAFDRLGFQQRVAEIFAALGRPYIERIAAASEPDAVHDAVKRAVRRRLGLSI
jgi:dTMP kinase